MLTLKSPAKINWFLNVLGMRDDGFHEIQSLMQKITLYDILTFTPSDDLILETDASIPAEQNLVHRAAMLLRNACGVKKGALITLKKNIPAGAGLGGGSSNAASTLLGLNTLWALDLSIENLCNMAEKLGSDVPFFLFGPIALSRGRGEKIIPCKTEKTANLLLVKPPFPVSTAWAYGEYRNKLQDAGYRILPEDKSTERSKNKYKKDPHSRSHAKHSQLTKKDNDVDNIEFLIRKIVNAEFEDVKDILINDLESVILKSFPVISEIKDRLIEEGAIFSMMSGSGPTVFGIFRSVEDAENASVDFSGCWTTVARTIIDK